jgi:hypothetical protein
MIEIKSARPDRPDQSPANPGSRRSITCFKSFFAIFQRRRPRDFIAQPSLDLRNSVILLPQRNRHSQCQTAAAAIAPSTPSSLPSPPGSGQDTHT